MMWYFYVIREMAFGMSKRKVTVLNYGSPSTKYAYLYYEMETTAIKQRFEVDINSRDSLIEIILWYQKTSNMIFGEKTLR